MGNVRRLHPKCKKGDIFVSPDILMGEERIVFVRGVIGSVTADSTPIGPIIAGDDLALCLTQLDRESDEPIKMVINSPGGSVDDGFIVVNTMMMLRSPVWTFVQSASSFAAVLATLGDKGHRYMLPYATMMLHAALVMIQGKEADVEAAREVHKRWANTIYDLLIERTELSKKEPQIKATIAALLEGVSSEEVEESSEPRKAFKPEEATREAFATFFKSDRYYSAKAARSFGLIDEIVTPEVFRSFFNVPQI